jgi:hypothetical protein
VHIDIVLHDDHLFVGKSLICTGEVVDFRAQKVVKDGLKQLEQQIFKDHLRNFMVENKDKPLFLFGGK